MNFLQRLKLNIHDDYEARKEAYWYIPTQTPERIIDFGAHKGFVSIMFARKYPKAIIHAYEPNSKNFKKLAHNTRNYKNIRCFNEAAAGYDGETDFCISERDVGSTIYEDFSIFAIDTPIKIPCISLKTALERIGAPAFLKIDVEGAEYEVLKDLPEGIAEIRGEIHPLRDYTVDDMKQRLSRFATVFVPSTKSFFSAV
jgi:FkbM family methyltransferase